MRDALSEVEREEQHDQLEQRFKALEERKPDLRLGDIVSALENASDDELNALEGTVLKGLVAEAREGEQPAPPTGDGNDNPPPPPAEKKKRPGRKSGAAYDWWVDDATGEVVKLDVARVYTGADEPDEVEIG